MSHNLFIPNLHSWYITMKQHDSLNLVNFVMLLRRAYQSFFLSCTQSFSHSGLHGPSINVRATKSSCLPNSLTHTRLTTNTSLQTWCNCQSCVPLTFIPIRRSTGYFQWSRLTFTDTSSRPYGKMLYFQLTNNTCNPNEIVSPRSHKVLFPCIISNL